LDPELPQLGSCGGSGSPVFDGNLARQGAAARGMAALGKVWYGLAWQGKEKQIRLGGANYRQQQMEISRLRVGKVESG